MRIALHAVGEAGRRAGLILLAERNLEALGLYGHGGQQVADRRTLAIRSLDGFGVLVTDDRDAASGLAGIACDDGLSCVVAADRVDDDVVARFDDAGLTVVVGATLEGIAESLAAHEIARVDHADTTTIAWTTPGKPRRRGHPVAFPDPVGARWGRVISTRGPVRRLRVPITGEWAAAAASVAGEVDGRVVDRVVGVADHRAHLEGISLAAAALLVATGDLPAGLVRPGDHADAYLSAALGVGLEVAAYSSP